MLSIGAMGTGQGNYYIGLTQESYYLQGGEPAGRWIGSGSPLLGLSPLVEPARFLSLFAGVGAKGEALVQNAGDPKRQPGWDLTFSAPKSVSCVWAIADPQMRSAIEAAQFAALEEAVSYIEEGALTRRGKSGAIKEKAALVVAAFEHGTSRAGDPQLHTHAVLLNVGIRADGTTGSLESRSFYQSKMAAGALYRAELAHQLMQLGFSLRREGTSFEIVGVPLALREQTSTRRKEIEQALAARGESGGRAAAFAALATRGKKEHVSREALFPLWRELGRAHGLGPESVRALCGRTPATAGAPQRDPAVLAGTTTQAAVQESVQEALTKLSADQSHFGARDLLRALSEAAPGRGLSGGEIRQQVARELVHNGDLVLLGEQNGEKRYATRELLQVEQTLLSDARDLQTAKAVPVSDRVRETAASRVEARATETARAADPAAPAAAMTVEQKAALRHLTGEERIALVAGMAGTGKTFLLQAAREAWEQSGCRVIGAAVAGKAARGLQEGAGIESVTLHRLLQDPQPGPRLDGPAAASVSRVPKPGLARRLLAEWKHATWQITGATKEKLLGNGGPEPTSRLSHEWQYATHQISAKQRDYLNRQIADREAQETLRLDANTVVVVDEAGMVGTRAMASLVEKVTAAGAKLVLVGDARQLQPIDMGGPFRFLENLLGAARLETIVRQELDKTDRNPAWRREAVKAFADGEAGKALKAYQERGFLSVAPTRDGASEKLIAAWTREGSARPAENLIFAATREETRDLNRRAQAARERDGKLGLRSIRLGGERICEKDRVLITQNNRQLGVSNGDLGTVKRLELITGKMVIRLDRGGEVSLPYRHFQNVELGYAVTTHKGQGVTVKNSFVLCGGAMTDREMSYVQASRARRDTHFFTEEIRVWNPDTARREEQTLEELARRMSQSRAKDLAHSVTPAPAAPVPERRPLSPEPVPELLPGG